ncbi:MAG TPA: secondary thiamine-phosphate synthase enzyme YjbQ [Phycisphaerales bacterium]|nr:secondary thiamine-phosphate synthase enzyme YjbQ [Phycisphaerales bacterium]
MIQTLRVPTRGQGLYDITAQVRAVVQEAMKDAGAQAEGLCTLFIRHTSASLLIQENADPAVRADLQNWFARLVPEHDSIYTHKEEGPDDMPAHVKSALTQVSLSIPIVGGSLALGTWQGIYVWEHRRAAHTREIVVHVAG